MANAYVVRPLAPEQVVQAFPLVSMLDMALTIDRWCEYAASLGATTDGGGGHRILSVQSGQGHIYGISAYCLKPDLHRDRILEIENFAVIDVAGTRRVAQVLLDGLEDLAQQQGCSCIVINLLSPALRRQLRGPNGSGVDLFKATGFYGDKVRLRKCFNGAAEPEAAL